MGMPKASAPLVEFMRDPDRYVDEVRDATEPLLLTEADGPGMVLLSAGAYDLLRSRLSERAPS